MNLSDIITKCYILALIIRDDGERLLLGDGFFEFKDNLQHFQPNTFVNDAVELQGTDGQLLAGQVRRTAVQTFEGYIADNTISQSNTEEYRRQFLGFFRKKHFYKVVYIMPNGTAVQRDRGYIVNAPSVPELYQRFPEYSVGLSFEDPNYYEYGEDDAGNEIFAHIQALELWHDLEAGLIWDALGAVSDDISWVQFETAQTIDGYAQINNGLDRPSPLTITQLLGNTEQKTLSGKNLLNITNSDLRQTSAGLNLSFNSDGTIHYTGTPSQTYAFFTTEINLALPAGTYTFGIGSINSSANVYLRFKMADTTEEIVQIDKGVGPSITYTFTQATVSYLLAFRGMTVNTAISGDIKQQLELGSQATSYEPYCGGVPSPNPDYPQEIKTVSGAQTVKITGKNLFDRDNAAENSGLTWANGTIVTDNKSITSDYIAAKGGDNFSLNFNTYVFCYDGNRAYLGVIQQNGTSIGKNNAGVFSTFTIPSMVGVAYIRLWLRTTANSNKDMNQQDIMLNFGSTTTTYEPYQGQSYTIDLDTIELCKIGTYQDYIYKSGDKWYKHEAVGKINMADIVGWATSTGGSLYATGFTSAYNAKVDITLSNIFTHDWTAWAGAGKFGITSSGNLWIMTGDTSVVDTNVSTWLTSKSAIMFYILATPTDTEITDSELVGQLNTISELYQGMNNLWLIPSAGAQGEMEVTWFVYDKNNRYDKYLWINQNSEYESI